MNKNFTFALAKVKEVDIRRYWFYASWAKWYAAAFFYAGGSIINRSSHNNKPIIDKSVPIACGSLAVLGTSSLLLRYRKCKMDNNWHFKVLDFDIFKAQGTNKE